MVSGILFSSETEPSGFQGVVVAGREGLEGGSQRPWIVGGRDSREGIVDRHGRRVEELCHHGRDVVSAGDMARAGMSSGGLPTVRAEAVRLRGFSIGEARGGRRGHHRGGDRSALQSPWKFVAR